MTESSDKFKAVQRMQDYIEKHLTEPITLLELAKAAEYSPWHSARIFKELTGKAPFEYIRALRLTRAALRMRDDPAKVVDIALDFVFDSHEGFTRAFTREFGLPPSSYMKNTPPVKYFMPNRILDHDFKLCKGEMKMPEKEKTSTVFVQVVERPARKLIIRRGVKATDYYEYCEEVGCDIWGILSSIKEALYEPIGMWLPPHMVRPGTSAYAQGVEVAMDYKGEVPDGCELIELPACKMMIFQGQPYDDEKFEEAISDIWEVMKDYDPGIYGYRWADEDGPRFQLAPMGYRGYIEGRPVRQI